METKNALNERTTLEDQVDTLLEQYILPLLENEGGMFSDFYFFTYQSEKLSKIFAQ